MAMASSNTSKRVLPKSRNVPEPIDPLPTNTIVGSQELDAQPTSSSAAPSIKSTGTVSTASPTPDSTAPTARLRLRSTQYPDAISDFELAAWKLKASFRRVALRLVSLVGTADSKDLVDTSRASEMAKNLKDVLDSTNADEHQQLNELSAELEQELQRCCDFFQSCSTIFNKYAGPVSVEYVNLERLDRLEKELKSALTKALEANQHEKDFLTAVCQGVLSNILIAFKAENAEIQRIEERLARSYYESAHKSILKKVEEQTIGVLSATNIFQECVKKSQSLPYSLKRPINVQKPGDWDHPEILKKRIKQKIQDLMDRNAIKFDDFYKNTKGTFEVCRAVFDHLFTRKLEFCSLEDLQQVGEYALVGALQKFDEVHKQLRPAERDHIRQMLKNYAFESMLKCASGIPNAPHALAKKAHVTIMYGINRVHTHYSTSPLKIYVEGLEAIVLDPHLWLKNGNFMVIYSRLSTRFSAETESKLNVNTLAVDGFQADMRSSWYLFSKSVGISTTYPEQAMGAYFGEVKTYLLENHQIVPSTLTVIVKDSTKFLCKHRINSAIQLAGLPSAKFMSYTGAVAAGYFDSNSVNDAGNTLFIVATERLGSAQCHFSNTLKISSIVSEDYSYYDESVGFICDQVRQNPDVNSVIIIHDFTDMGWSYHPATLLEGLLPSQLTLLHPFHATDEQLSALAIAGAAFVNKYPSDAVYSESAQYELSYQICNEPLKILVRPAECIEQDVFDLAFLELVSNESLSLVVFEESVPVAQFNLPSASLTEKLLCSMQLSKDGVLSKPEIRIKSSNQLVEWKMTGHLMSWNDKQFQEMQDPEIAMWKLKDLETTPMKLKNVTLSRPSSSSSSQRPKDDAEIEELRKLAQELLKVWSESSAPVPIRKQARRKVDKAYLLLRDPNVRLRKAQVFLMIQKLKCYIESLKGLEIIR